MSWYKKSGKNDFEEFINKGAGWLTPSNKLLVAPYWKHIEVLQEEIEKNPRDYPELSSMVEGHRETLKAVEEDASREVDETGGGWHNYDMTKDDLDDEFVTAIYDQGALVRLVLDEKERKVKAEGSPAGIQNHLPNLKRLVNKLNEIPYAAMSESGEYFPYKLETQLWYSK